MTVDEARRRLRALRDTWEWAFAHAHTHTWGTDPRLDWVHREEARLLAVIRAG